MPDPLAATPELSALRRAAHDELLTNILPFWESRAFDGSGRLVGSVADDGTASDDGPRSAVLVARIVWTFGAAAAADVGGQRERWLVTGRKALAWLTGPLWDESHGGVYWAVDGDGRVESDRKQVYAQAFAIYALAQWHLATGEEDALDRAIAVFELLETHARDAERGGYIEALDRDWGALADMALSAKDLNVPKSMNTNLHVMEALTTLLRAVRASRSAAPAVRAHVGEALAAVTFATQEFIVFDEPWMHCALFFDSDWNRVGDTISYGHDIEASWLIWDAHEALADAGLASDQDRAVAEATALGLADAVLEHGVDPDGAVLYEGGPEGVRAPQKHWWPQAEGVVGWLNAYQVDPEPEYLAAALGTWAFIESKVIDREHGEWFAELERDGTPRVGPPLGTAEGEVKIGPWKCPYHNGRACLEVMRRVF